MVGHLLGGAARHHREQDGAPLLGGQGLVFIPLAALGALLVVLSRRLRERYGGLTVLVGVVAAASGFAALLTGPLLAAVAGLVLVALTGEAGATAVWG